MDKSEREEIINEAVERTILMIPEVVGNLIMNHAAKMRVSSKFYEKYPQFKEFKQVVASVIEKYDDENIGEDFEKVLEKSVPEVERRIAKVKDLNMTEVKKPDLKIPFGSGEI